jgi:hypothetical protein
MPVSTPTISAWVHIQVASAAAPSSNIVWKISFGFRSICYPKLRQNYYSPERANKIIVLFPVFKEL